jgi:hypothetical protein
VAPEPRFEWFAVHPERWDTDTSDRSSLREYLEARATTGQRTEIIAFELTFYREADRTGNFRFTLAQRTAEQATEASGKGAVDCDTGLIMVWTVGSQKPTL